LPARSALLLRSTRLAARCTDVIDPATRQCVGRRAPVNAAETDRALSAVTVAQSDWKRGDAKTRAAVLHDIENRIEAADRSTVAVLMTRETGQP